MTISQTIAQVQTRIKNACVSAHRSPDSVKLLAVSKTKPADAIRQAYQAGLRDFGENYVQEGTDKISQLKDLTDICWHFIGPLQSNKTRLVAENFDWMHSLERMKIAERLSQQRPPQCEPLNVLIQINLDNEKSKAGIQLAQVNEFAAALKNLPGIRLRGLMAIPSAEATDAGRSASYQRLFAAFSALREQYPAADTLSLGMSNDMQAAIAEGSTMVRIGSAIFGPRNL